MKSIAGFMLLTLILLRPYLPPPQEWRPIQPDIIIVLPDEPASLVWQIKPGKPDKPKKPKKHPKRQLRCLHPERYIYDPDTLCLPDQP